MNERLTGRRRYEHEIEAGLPVAMLPGDYWKNGALWYCCVPEVALVGNLAKHDIEEHEDGTITVRPSILVTSTRPGEPRYHGWLVRGVWEACE